MSSILIYISAFLLATLTLVLIHEFGHFLVARVFKVKVERFSIGFGKPLYRWKNKTNHTEYVIAPILIGGYVKLLDTRETPTALADRHLAFDQQSILKRLAIVLAGPTTNVVFALFAFWLMFTIGFESPKPIIGKIIPNSSASYAKIRENEEIIKIDRSPTNSWEEVIIALIARTGDTGILSITTDIKAYQLNLNNWKIDSQTPDPLAAIGIIPYIPGVPPIIGKIAKNSPAEKYGLQKNDYIFAIENKPIKTWEDFIKTIEKYPDKFIKIRLKRGGKTIDLAVLTGSKYGPKKEKFGFMGVSSLPVTYPETMLRIHNYTLLQAIDAAWQQILLFTKLNAIVFKKIFTGKLSLSVLGGPIAIFAASGQALSQGFIMFLGFLATLSLSIALINLLPLPGLDGSYILLFAIEFITRRPLSLKTQTLLLRIGMILLILLITKATINDLKRLIL